MIVHLFEDQKFVDVTIDNFENIQLNSKSIIKTSWIYQLSKKINTTPSLYLTAGAIHGCVLCREDAPYLVLYNRQFRPW